MSLSTTCNRQKNQPSAAFTPVHNSKSYRSWSDSEKEKAAESLIDSFFNKQTLEDPIGISRYLIVETLASCIEGLKNPNRPANRKTILSAIPALFIKKMLEKFGYDTIMKDHSSLLKDIWANIIFFPKDHYRFTFVDYLLSKGSNINDPLDDDQRTILHIAAAMADIDLIHFLIKKGARIDIKDKDGMLPYDLMILHKKLLEKCLAGQATIIQKVIVNSSGLVELNQASLDRYNTLEASRLLS